jgi:recombination associated protein RdgC
LEELLEGMIFLDLWQDKMFLGQEFLTWLYLTSERDEHIFELENGMQVEAWFENSLQLTYGQGPNKRSVSITTPEDPRDPDWDEAYTALGNNKKVTKGTLKIKCEDRQFRLTLPHDTLSPQGLKFSTVKDTTESDDLGKAGKFLERIATTADLFSILEGLFNLFLSQRLTEAWEEEELPRLKEYLSKRK